MVLMDPPRTLVDNQANQRGRAGSTNKTAKVAVGFQKNQNHQPVRTSPIDASLTQVLIGQLDEDD